VALFPLVLWVSGFLEPPELRRLILIWRTTRRSTRVRVTASEPTEMGGEIVGDGSQTMEAETPDDLRPR